ncbi:DUF6069 family protein [Pseudonocardia cypriaca]|uniref:Uncharacterized protein n=1 Tax=Pseudonocardia cypriaca TaxID=882449 RepID=A0A543FSR6_9PSEU|nr:DUF6069 family protein [Pseudonocardia cypriaca]TQM36794.1 hypothetical protein FB388_3980 [Pseudonocardia cypriaca]
MTTSAPTARGFALSVLTIVVGAGILNTLIAVAARALGADTTAVPGLTAPAYLTFTVIGTVLGTLGWSTVRRCAASPSRVMSWLVPLVIVVSLVPDVLIAVSAGPVAGIALGLMHLAVLAVALPTFRHFLPLPR